MPAFESPDDLMARRVGEVVQSTSTSFTAQCYRTGEAPPLGSLVRTNAPDIYGVVGQIITEPLDSARPVLARGENTSSETELFQGNPQLSRLLTTRIEAVIVGHETGESMKQSLPPLPPGVHSFLYACDAPEVLRFTRTLDFLHLLLNSGSSHADEVVGACLDRVSACHETPSEFLTRAGRSLAAELAGDVARLSYILRRVAR